MLDTLQSYMRYLKKYGAALWLFFIILCSVYVYDTWIDTVQAKSTPASDHSMSEEGESYIPLKVKKGTNLIKIARKFCKQEECWSKLAEINDIDDPYLIISGATIYAPQELLITKSVTAYVASLSGGVFSLDKDGTLLPVQKGDRIIPGQTLITENDGFTHLIFPDNSYVRISSNSKFTMTYLVRLVDESLKAEFFLDRGDISFDVKKKLKENETFNTRTPVSITGIRGTRFRVKMDNGVNRVETLHGSVAITAAGKKMNIDAGYGSVINSNGIVSSKEDLPPPPLIAMADIYKTPQFLVDTSGETGTVRLRITSDPQGHKTVWRGEIDNGRQFTIRGLEDGLYYAFFTAISPNGLEGLPTRANEFHLRTIPAAPLLGQQYNGKALYGTSIPYRWLIVNSAQTYEVEIARDRFFTLVERRENINSTKFTAENMKPGNYFVRIAAVAQDGFHSAYSAIDNVELRPMPTFDNFKPSAAGDNLTLQWREIDGVDSFGIEIAQDNKFTTVIERADKLEIPSYTIQNTLSPGTYYVRMRAETSDDKSPWTPPQKLEVDPAPFGILDVGILSLFLGLMLL